MGTLTGRVRQHLPRAVTALVLIGTLTSCGAPGSGPTSTDPSIPAAPSAAPYISALTMTRTWAAAETEIAVRAAIDGTTRNLSGRGEVAIDKGYADITWSGSGTVGRELVNDRAIFTQALAPGGAWVRTETGGRTPTSAFANPLLNLSAVQDVITDGTDPVDGVEAVRYRGTLPISAASLEGLALTSDEIARIIAAAAPDDSIAVTAWADPHHRLVRIDRSLVLGGDSPVRADVLASTRLRNFGVMLDLESPPSASVVTATPST